VTTAEAFKQGEMTMDKLLKQDAHSNNEANEQEDLRDRLSQALSTWEDEGGAVSDEG
jgi:hypothetical protein